MRNLWLLGLSFVVIGCSSEKAVSPPLKSEPERPLAASKLPSKNENWCDQAQKWMDEEQKRSDMIRQHYTDLLKRMREIEAENVKLADYVKQADIDAETYSNRYRANKMGLRSERGTAYDRPGDSGLDRILNRSKADRDLYDKAEEAERNYATYKSQIEANVKEYRKAEASLKALESQFDECKANINYYDRYLLQCK